VNIGLFIACKK